MLFHCYLDDSKDKHQSFAYVCAGLHGDRRAWKCFRDAWNRQLGDEQIAYYKTSEWARLEGCFARFRRLDKPFGREAADRAKSRLRAVIENARGIRGVGSVVPVEAYEQVLNEHAGSEMVFKPEYIYHRAFELAIMRAKIFTCVSSDDKIAFVHDEQEDFDKLRTLYLDFKRKNRKTAPFLVGFFPQNDKATPELQAADMFANSVMRVTYNLHHSKDSQFSEIVKFKQSRLALCSKTLLEKILRKNMMNRGLPIPESLSKAVEKAEELETI